MCERLGYSMGTEVFGVVTHAFREGAKVRIESTDGGASEERVLEGSLSVNKALVINAISVGVIQGIYDTVIQGQHCSMIIRT